MIVSKKRIDDYNYKIEDLKNQLSQKEKDYREMLNFYSNLLNDVYNDLSELNRCLKQKIAKEKIQIRVQDMIIKIGGKRNE